MALPTKKPDLSVIIGAGKPPPPATPPPADEAKTGPSPEFIQAYKEYEATPSPETFWRAIRACQNSY